MAAPAATPGGSSALPPLHPPRALAASFLGELLAELAEEEQAELADLLRHLRLEARLARAGGPRPLWRRLAAAAQEAAREGAGVLPLQGEGGDDEGHSTQAPALPSAPAGLALEERPGMGRVLVATREFGPGEPIFAEAPLLVIPNCARGPAAPPGPIMEALQAQHAGVRVQLDMDVLCDFFACCPADSLRRLAPLESHGGRLDFVAGRLAGEVSRLAVTRGVLKDPSREGELAEFLRVVSVNAHTVPRVHGVMLFFWLSMFSHSCAPNATYSTDTASEAGSGAEAYVAMPRALRRIGPGEMVCMGYLSLQMLLASAPIRQELLRVQKGFVCACPRCRSPDVARALPCPRQGCSGWPVPALSVAPEERGTYVWYCHVCAGSFGESTRSSTSPGCGDGVVNSLRATLEREERLVRFLLHFDPGGDEQTVRSLLEVIDEDLGRGAGRHAEHFLRAWILMLLCRLLLARCSGEGGGGEAAAAAADGGRLAARAAAVLWAVRARVERRAPSCLHLLAIEFGVPAAKALGAAGRGPEAAQVAAAFEGPLAAALGPRHPDVRFLGYTRAAAVAAASAAATAGDRASDVVLGALPPKKVLVICDACGAPRAAWPPWGGTCQASAEPSESNPEFQSGETETAKPEAGAEAAGAAALRPPPEAPFSGANGVPEATWCQRCGLAPFCGAVCVADGAAAHAPLCVTSEGPAAAAPRPRRQGPKEDET